MARKQRIFAVCILSLVLTLLLTMSGCGSSLSYGSFTRMHVQALLGQGKVEDMAWSADGNILAIASSVGIWLYTPTALDHTPRLLQGLEASQWMRSIALSPDGTMIAAGDSEGVVHLLHAASGEELARLEGHTGYVTSIAFSPDGAHLVSASNYIYDLTVRVWDTKTGSQVAIHDHYLWPIQSVAYSPTGDVVAYGTAEGTIHLWEWAGNAESPMLKPANGRGEVFSLAYSPDGQYLAAGDNTGIVRLWQTTDNSELATLTGHTHAVNRVRFSPDGKMLASGSDDGTIRLWQLPAQGQASVTSELATLPEPPPTTSDGVEAVSGLAFSPDGTRLATGSKDGSL